MSPCIHFEGNKTHERVVGNLNGLYFTLVLHEPGLTSEVTKKQWFEMCMEADKLCPHPGLFAVTPTRGQEGV